MVKHNRKEFDFPEDSLNHTYWPHQFSYLGQWDLNDQMSRVLDRSYLLWTWATLGVNHHLQCAYPAGTLRKWPGQVRQQLFSDGSSWRTGVVMPFEMPISHIKGSSPGSMPVNAYPGRGWMMGQVCGSLPYTWETWIEFPAPDFHLTQHLGSDLSLSPSCYLSNTYESMFVLLKNPIVKK